MYIILTILLCLVLGFYLNRLFLIERFRKLFVFSLLLHICGGFAVYLLYKFYYQHGDILTYEKDLLLIFQTFSQEPIQYFQFLISENNQLIQLINQQERSMFFLKFVSLIYFLSNANIYLVHLILATLSFITSWIFIKKINTCFPGQEYVAIFSFACVPSVVFWGSGLLKETLTLIFIYSISICVLQLCFSKKQKQSYLFALLLTGFFLFQLRYFVFAIAIPCVCLVFIFHFSNVWVKRKKVIVVIFLLAFVLVCFGILQSHPNLYVSRMLSVLIDNHNSVVALSEKGDYINFPWLSHSWLSVLLNIPFAAFFGFIRPFIWEADNLFQFFSGLENTIILALIVYQLTRLSTLWKSKQAKYWFYVSFAYIFSLSALLTLSTPNFGSLNRYRIVFLPFLIFWLLYQNPILNKWQKKIVKTAE